jgi:dipeptidyl aminopeptidase/acylaminoacyl peptidase
VPNNGVPIGPREYVWHAIAPATLVWAEALDQGDPKVNVPQRDRVLSLAAPFSGDPAEVMKTEYRFRSIRWTDRGVALVNEFDRVRRWTRTWIVDAAGAAPRKLWDVSEEDRYADPGAPIMRPGSPHRTIIQSGDFIYTAGNGGTPQGDRPFLSRVNLRTGAGERLFQTDATSYEPVVGLLSDDGSAFLTRRETASEPPNYFVRQGATSPRSPHSPIPRRS